jgi:hypothetical protein
LLQRQNIITDGCIDQLIYQLYHLAIKEMESWKIRLDQIKDLRHQIKDLRRGVNQMMQIIIDVPNELGKQLQPFQDRLPEVLERGLRDLRSEKSSRVEDEQTIMVLLASQPTPEEILGIRPSPELQARVSELLAKNKTTPLTRPEEAELERYLTLEHLVRLAKAHAYKQLNQKQ